MVWWVQTLEIANNEGTGSGKYRKVATSDEGGGIHGLCSHQHDTIEEAETCQEAIDNEGPIVGVPHMNKIEKREHVFDAATYQMLTEAVKREDMAEIRRLVGIDEKTE